MADQRSRYDRVVQNATAMLTAGGMDALHMKELAQRAQVSLDALYRHFPSTEHLLAAVAIDRQERAYRRVLTEPQRGRTARERVAAYLLREFGTSQRDEKLTAALFRAPGETSQIYGESLERVHQLHLMTLRAVAEGAGPMSEHQLRVLPIVGHVFSAATSGWLTGSFSAAEARFEIVIGCRLLDLPGAAVEYDLERATIAGSHPIL